MEYKLIACDMDATALTSDKRLSSKTAAAMEKALSIGKQVVFSTGRNISLVRPYMEQVAGMRYAVTGSGATVNDITENMHVYDCNIDAETVKWIISAAAGMDVLPIMFIGDKAYCPDWAPERAEDYFVGAYAQTYRRYMTKVDGVFNFFMENPQDAQKVNLLFNDKDQKDMVYEQIKLLPVTFTTITDFSMEINANGVSKAKGLEKLCAKLGITMAECIAVGDAENDLDMIKAAGLGIAMGNAQPEVIAAADLTVSDNAHDGVAEAIQRYLL